MDGHAIVANVQELSLLDLPLGGDDEAFGAHAPGHVGMLVGVMEEVKDRKEGVGLVDADVAFVLLVVVDPRTFAAFGPKKVGKSKVLLVFLEDVISVLVILFEEIGEVKLWFQIFALKYIPDVVVAPDNCLSVPLQAFRNISVMLLHKCDMVHRHVLEILGQQLKVQPLRLGPLILLPLLAHEGTLNLSHKLMLKDIEQVQLLKRILHIALHDLPINGKQRHEYVFVELNIHFKST